MIVSNTPKIPENHSKLGELRNNPTDDHLRVNCLIRLEPKSLLGNKVESWYSDNQYN